MYEKTLLSAGLALVLIGTYYLSKAVFLYAIASRYWLRGREGVGLRWKMSGLLFGLNQGNWHQVFMSDDQLSEAQIKRVRDPFAPIRGFIFVFIGTVFQIAGTLLS